MSFNEWYNKSLILKLGVPALAVIAVYVAGNVTDSLLGHVALTLVLCTAEVVVLYALYYLRHRRRHP